ncbi:MAG TPA: hypothetical protein VFG37_12610, partial [Planctomycetota bacterium]|nr:hypothetical protein [Planctomycetota bacterium]
MFSARRLGLLICGLLLPIQPPASGQETERVSVDSAGAEANGDSYAWGGGISGDGRCVVFGSYASNLVANDTNALRDVFVRDRETGTTERVSVDSAGGQADDFSWNFEFAISTDGRCVAFVSYASNLVQGDTNQDEDVFVHDRATGTTERVSVDSAGGQANGGNRHVPGSSQPSISADGQVVAFTSFADNLVTGDANGVSDVFVHDRSSGVTERVSVDSAGAEANGASDGPAISADGRFVAFTSAADDLVAGDTNQTYDVFVHDRATGTTERVSVDSLGVEGNATSSVASISADGQVVAFHSSASNLVAGDSNGTYDVFVHDRSTGITERGSVDSSGRQADGGSSYPSLSSDGRRLAFRSFATNLVSNDTNGVGDVFLRDRTTGTTERVSVDASEAEADGESFSAAISGDGRIVAFTSIATNLIAGDTNSFYDVFVRDTGVPAAWSNYGTGVAGTNGVPSLTSQLPVLGTTITVTVGNSLGAPTVG